MTAEDRLKELIEKHLKTKPAEFARTIGVSTNDISQILKKESLLSFAIQIKISQKFPDLNMEWLINGVGHPFPIKGKKTKKPFRQEELDIAKKVGKIVRKLRLDNNKNLEDIAEILNLSLTGYQAIEAGRVNIHVPKIIALSEYYKKSYYYIIHGHEPPVNKSEIDNLKKENQLLKEELDIVKKNCELLQKQLEFYKNT